jgi:hypothetical protein
MSCPYSYGIHLYSNCLDNLFHTIYYSELLDRILSRGVMKRKFEIVKMVKK